MLSQKLDLYKLIKHKLRNNKKVLEKFQKIKFLLKCLIHKKRRVTNDLCSLFNKPVSYDSYIRYGSIGEIRYDYLYIMELFIVQQLLSSKAYNKR